MNFKLLIVDDETPIRKGLSDFIEWDTIDCEVCRAAADGLEAIEYLKENPVDIVITDIKMPGADGLKLSRFIYENMPDIRVIILSGYADFEYAQTAIKYGVVDFLLKPTSKEKLLLAVQSAQKQLIRSMRQQDMEKEKSAFLKEQLLQELTDSVLREGGPEQLRSCGLSLRHYFVAAFRLLSGSGDLQHLKKIVIAQKSGSYCYRYNNLILSVYFIGRPCQEPPAFILDNCREILDIVGSLYDMKLSIGVSRYHGADGEFAEAASEAIAALSRNFYMEGQISVYTKTADSGNYFLSADYTLDLYNLETYLNDWLTDSARAAVTAMFTKLKSHFVKSQDVKNICTQIYYICSRVLMKKEAGSLSADILTKIYKCHDIFELEAIISSLLDYVFTALTGEGGGHSRIVTSAIKYIRQNYREPLSLEIIAGRIPVNPSHLSRTFKKECGCSLTEYINQVRVEKARELLADSDTLNYEVSEMVGYNDPAYFSSIFRKLTGLSPKEYRAGRLNREDPGVIPSSPTSSS